MIYLAASILSSVIIFLLFRQIERSGAVTRHVIMLNYLVAGLLGLFFFSHETDVWQSAWFWPAAAMGVLFYMVFRLIARTTQLSGVAIASIATKMSVIIPICVGIGLLGEGLGLIKFAGIALGLVAVWLSIDPSNKSADWKWPLVTFIASGFIDTSLNLFQRFWVAEEAFVSFITVIFAFAFFSGVAHHFMTTNRTIKPMSMTFGVLLGLANFGSLYFVLKTLKLPDWESSVVFPMNNVGIVIFSSLFAIVLWKEQPTLRTGFGIILAICSLLLLYLSTT